MDSFDIEPHNEATNTDNDTFTQHGNKSWEYVVTVKEKVASES